MDEPAPVSGSASYPDLRDWVTDESLLPVFSEEVDRAREWVSRRLSPAFRRRFGSTNDVVDDAIVTLLKHVPKFRTRSALHFRRLFRRIVRNSLNGRLRPFYKERRLLDGYSAAGGSVVDLDQVPDSATGISSAVDARERIAWLRIAMECVGEAPREIIELRQLAGLSFAEIGNHLGIAEDAARMRFNRALGTLRKAVEKLRQGTLPLDPEKDAEHG